VQVSGEKYKYGCGGIFIGLFFGLMLGWMFHGFVNLVVRLGIVAVLLVPVLFALWIFLGNNRNRSRVNPDDGIMDADWRDVPPR